MPSARSDGRDSPRPHQPHIAAIVEERRKRGAYGFGTGRRGSFDPGTPDRFSAGDAARYMSKYLRPDRANTSFVPLLEAINRLTPRDPATGRHKQLVRPVYVSTALTRLTGVTMGFLRYRRFAFRKWGGWLVYTSPSPRD